MNLKIINNISPNDSKNTQHIHILLTETDHCKSNGAYDLSIKLMEWQAWTNCAPDAYRARSGAQNLWGALILPCEKEKIIRFTNFQLNRLNNEKVTVNSKYYRVLVYFDIYISNGVKTTLSAYDWETFDWEPFKHPRCLIHSNVS